MMVSHLDEHRRTAAISVALATGTVAAGIGLLAVSGYLISKAALEPPVLSLTVAIVAVRFFAITRAVLRYLERLVSHDLAFRLLASVRVAFYGRLSSLAPVSFARLRSSDLLSRFVADVDSLQNVFLRVLAPPLVALFTAVFAVAVATALLPATGLALAAWLALAGILLPVAGRAAGGARRGQAAARAELAVELDDVLRGAPELVLYGATHDRKARVQAADRRLMRLARSDALTAGMTGGLGVALAGLALVAVLIAAIPAVSDGRLPGTQLAVLAFVTLAVFEAITPLSAAVQQFSVVAGADARLDEITSAAPAAITSGPRPGPGSGARTIGVEDGRLRYGPDGPWVLEGINLRLERGRRIAVVGPSGSGKTTLAHVLVRFCDLTSGRATLDGHDVREYAATGVREAVLLASEDAYLFATTIRENLRLGRPDATDAELTDALRRVGLGPWIESLADGLDTRVGENGALVSGGQRRRIALARALLADAPFLILDEPTADLDEPSAAAFLDGLLATAADTGLLVITHRLAGLDRFDEILVLDGGRVIERGSERELLRPGTRYHALHEQQSR
jgi:thiol reductant ABC exporter CydC subunit